MQPPFLLFESRQDMKANILIVILCLETFAVHCQIGFNKKFNLKSSNAFMGSIINNDTILVLGSSTDFVNGWQFSTIAIDTNGQIVNTFDYQRDSFQLTSWSAENSKLITRDGENLNVLAVKDSKNDEIEIHFVLTNGTIIKSKQFKIASSKESKRLFGIIEVSDGYLISGQVQYTSSTLKSFILKTDLEGSKIYLKFYGEKDFWFTGSTLYHSPINENEVVLYGSYNSQGFGHVAFFHIDHKTGNVGRIDKVPGQTKNIVKPYSIYYSSHFNSPIGLGIMSNENQTELLPALVVFNDSFKVVRKDYFGINADQRYNGGDVEEPYQSAQDEEGNIYVATIQLLPFNEIEPLYQVIEALSITKFDKEHNHLWTTIDTVFHDGMYHGYAGYLSGVSVSSSGCVFITGHYAGPNPDEGGVWRNTAYLLKYDKDGCKVGGCRLVNAEEDVILEKQVKVYPNPANSSIAIMLPSDIREVIAEIRDINGLSILKEELSSSATIDISNLPNGIYVIQFSDGKSMVRKKFIKVD